MAYVPLALYLIGLMLRHRSATVFTAANPGIANGGAIGESKSATLEQLARVEGAVADFVVIGGAGEAAARIRTAHCWMARRRVAFPVVLKPDIGERGRGVALAWGHDELARYLVRARGATIVQRFVDGVEFGIFYQRLPGETRGHVVSIAETRHAVVVGDGRATLDALLRTDRWIAARAARSGKFGARRLRQVPRAGERVHLFELGFGCLDATFADRRTLCTPMLEHAIEALSRAHAGFCFGRFDVFAATDAHLQRGQFQVIELNGVLAEVTHINDPATGFAEAFGALRRQWHAAFAIGAANRAQGTRPTPFGVLMGLFWRKFADYLGEEARAMLRSRADTCERGTIATGRDPHRRQTASRAKPVRTA